MKIAFDIQTAIGGKNTGVGVYTDLVRKGFSARNDVELIELKRKSDKPILGALSRAWWEQIQMPSYASLTSADILFSPGFSAQKTIEFTKFKIYFFKICFLKINTNY